MNPPADTPADCVHRRGTGCLRQEILNPGFRPDFRCARLESLMEEFDAFLDRAETFGLTDAQAERIRRSQSKKKLPRSDCPLQKQEETPAAAAGAVAGCDLFLDGLCLQRLPRCVIPCPHGVPADDPSFI